MRNIKYTLIMSSVLFFCILCSCSNQHSFSDLHFLNSEEKIQTVCSISHRNITALTTDGGNCYIRGTNFDNHNNYGVENVEQFNSRFDSPFDNVSGDDYVMIYDKGNASKISVSEYGGIIITNDNCMYVFVNGNSYYRLPLLFDENCTDGYLYDSDTIYLLKENGDFGYVDINSPKHFNIIGKDIIKFRFQQITHFHGDITDNIFLLNKDGQLFITDNKQCVTNDVKFIPNVADFEVCNNSNAAYLTKDGALWYCDYYNSDIDIDYLMDNSKIQELHQNDIKSFSLYSGGIVFLYDNGNVYIHGYDFDYDIERDSIHDQLFAAHCRNISSGLNNISLIDYDGRLSFYGTTPDGFDKRLFE